MAHQRNDVALAVIDEDGEILGFFEARPMFINRLRAGREYYLEYEEDENRTITSYSLIEIDA